MVISFCTEQGMVINFKGRQDKLQAAIEGHTQEEIREAVKTIISEGTLDFWKLAVKKADALIENLPAMLVVIRKREPDLVITPEMLEAKRIQVAAQFQSDEDQLAETLASWPESLLAALDEESQKEIRNKIERLKQAVAENARPENIERIRKIAAYRKAQS
jgi:hypothetical protein